MNFSWLKRGLISSEELTLPARRRCTSGGSRSMGTPGGSNSSIYFLAVIPNYIWPEKYNFFGSYPIDDMRLVGSAAAFFVMLYESFGFVGVVSGMAFAGFLCRLVYDSYRANPNDPFAQIGLALTWAFLFHGYGRDSVVIVIVNAFLTLAPLWISVFLLKIHRTKFGKKYKRSS